MGLSQFGCHIKTRRQVGLREQAQPVHALSCFLRSKRHLVDEVAAAFGCCGLLYVGAYAGARSKELFRDHELALFLESFVQVACGEGEGEALVTNRIG